MGVAPAAGGAAATGSAGVFGRRLGAVPRRHRHGRRGVAACGVGTRRGVGRGRGVLEIEATPPGALAEHRAIGAEASEAFATRPAQSGRGVGGLAGPGKVAPGRHRTPDRGSEVGAGQASEASPEHDGVSVEASEASPEHDGVSVEASEASPEHGEVSVEASEA